MNTGGQRSGATLIRPGQVQRLLAPSCRRTPAISSRKDMVRIMAGHGIKYAATASIAFPVDYLRK